MPCWRSRRYSQARRDAPCTDRGCLLKEGLVAAFHNTRCAQVLWGCITVTSNARAELRGGESQHQPRGLCQGRQVLQGRLLQRCSAARASSGPAACVSALTASSLKYSASACRAGQDAGLGLSRRASPCYPDRPVARCIILLGSKLPLEWTLPQPGPQSRARTVPRAPGRDREYHLAEQCLHFLLWPGLALSPTSGSSSAAAASFVLPCLVSAFSYRLAPAPRSVCSVVCCVFCRAEEP